MAPARRKSSPARRFPWGRLLLVLLVIIQALWIAAFIRSTGTWLPRPPEWVFERTLLPGNDVRKEDQKLQDLLEELGSRGEEVLPEH